MKKFAIWQRNRLPNGKKFAKWQRKRLPNGKNICQVAKCAFRAVAFVESVRYNRQKRKTEDKNHEKIKCHREWVCGREDDGGRAARENALRGADGRRSVCGFPRCGRNADGSALVCGRCANKSDADPLAL